MFPFATKRFVAPGTVSMKNSLFAPTSNAWVGLLVSTPNCDPTNVLLKYAALVGTVKTTS